MLGDDWADAFKAAGWRPEASAPAGPAQALGPPPRAGGSGPAAAHWDRIQRAASKWGVTPSLLAGIVDFESSGNAGAINRSSGATGLGQVMPREAGFRDRPTQQELLDPDTNLDWSARILKSGLDRYGTEDKALAAYLGAIDARGNITGAVDANGTGGNQYIRTVRERQQRYGGQPAAGTTTGSASAGGPGGAAPQDDWTAPFRAAGWTPESAGSATRSATRGAATAPAPLASAPGAPGPGAAGAPVTDATGRQAIAASWALSQLGSKAFYDACQRFIENAYGTSGRFGSAAKAGQALFKTADPGQADVGDLVFFKPDASNGWQGHAAINLGGGEMVGATYAGVTRDNYLTNPYWSKLLVGFGDPPDQWTGRASTADLVKGAQGLIQSGQRAATAAAGAVQGAAGGASGIDLGDWASVFRRAGWNPGA